MKVTITITDTGDGTVEVSDERLPHNGETAETMTTATALADAMLKLLDDLGEIEEGEPG